MPKIKAKEDGISLIEVLVAILIFAAGILSLVALQHSGISAVADAHQRSQATAFANDIVDRMSANRAAAIASHYNLYGQQVFNASSSCSSTTSTCTPTQLAQMDLQEWSANLANTLPDGRAWISNNDSRVTVVIGWNAAGAALSADPSCGNDLVCIDVTVEI